MSTSENQFQIYRNCFDIKLLSISSLISDSEDGFFEERNDCLPNLALKHRVILFIIFNVIGYIMQIGGLTKLIEAFYTSEYKFFAIVYSLGNLEI